MAMGLSLQHVLWSVAQKLR
uniref:Uncharacterized protein n=1 Tax=Arundo donax TaxID=35708 RepID=A0A0A9MRV0_ARUDO